MRCRVLLYKYTNVSKGRAASIFRLRSNMFGRARF